ncbi:MAG: exodeoxyribonuclease III [Nanobdellota archaeon]
MRLLSWNVNGIRAALRNGFNKVLETEQPDIFLLQETKVQDFSLDSSYYEYWNDADKKGYAGTALLTKTQPKAVTFGEDTEGRVITAEFETFILINVYTPNSQRELKRLDYRQEWDRWFLDYLLSFKKPVIVGGDLNVAHKEIDIARPQQNRRNAGFTDEERQGFTRYIENGFIDTFREFNQEPGNYTYWSYMFNARQKNIGWRLDYFCVSQKAKKWLQDAFIRSDIHGSDHCPVGVILKT